MQSEMPGLKGVNLFMFKSYNKLVILFVSVGVFNPVSSP